jgi:hypothetical protein
MLVLAYLILALDPLILLLVLLTVELLRMLLALLTVKLFPVLLVRLLLLKKRKCTIVGKLIRTITSIY